MSLADVMAAICHLPEPESKRTSSVPRKIDAETAKAIRSDGRSLSRIARHHGLARSTVSRIKRGLLWRLA